MLKMCTVKKLDLKMCTIENSRSQNAGIIFLILKPGHLDLGLIGTVKLRAQETRGTRNSGWVFGMVVLRNSVEAEISQLDY